MADLDPLFRKAYILGGDATITLVSRKTDASFTYRVKASDDLQVHFVSVLTGPDNEHDFSYLGTIFEAGAKFVHTKKSKIALDAPSARAFAWLWRNIGSDDVRVLHSGKCSVCNRKLSREDSIDRGMGAKCAARVAEALARHAA